MRPGNVAFGIGQPSCDLLPTAMVRRAAAELFGGYADASGDPRESLQYADTRGTEGFRRQLAAFLGETVAAGRRTVDPDALVATNGSSLGLNMCAAALLRHGDTVLCEQYTYFLARKTLEDNGLNLVGVPCDDDGIIVEGLEDIARATNAKGFYCIPTYQNPTGTILSLERRRALVEIAQNRKMLLLCDDVYDALHWGADAAPPSPLVEIALENRNKEDRDGIASVVSIGSFSKIAGPGLRLGWLEASHSDLLIDILRSGWVDSGGGLNPITSEIMRVSMESGAFADNVARVKHELQLRCEALCDAVQEELGWKFLRPTGGYFVWVWVPIGVDIAKMRAEAEALPDGEGVSWMSSDIAAIPLSHPEESQGADTNRAIRLSFAFYGKDELVDGVRRIAKLPSVAAEL